MGAVLRVRNKKTNEMVDYVQEKMIQFSEVIVINDNMSSYRIPQDVLDGKGTLEIMVQQSSNENTQNNLPSHAKMIHNIRREGNLIKWDKDTMPCRIYPTMILGVS